MISEGEKGKSTVSQEMSNENHRFESVGFNAENVRTFFAIILLFVTNLNFL